MKNSKFKYFVIEDDTNVWKNIEERMQDFEKWQPIDFSSELTDALAKIEKHKPELIFTDWSIRGGNAYQILEKISDLNNYMPYVIFFTGYQSENPEIPQKIVNNFPIVKKYIVKPIYENLTNHLHEYVVEAESFAKSNNQIKEIWIEDFTKKKYKINPENCIAFLQIQDRPRYKELVIHKHPPIIVKYTWEDCLDFAKNYNLEFFIANQRKSVVNKKHITKIINKKIHLNNGLSIDVSREQWKILENNVF